MKKSFHSSDTTSKKVKDKILKTKAENIVNRANKVIATGVKNLYLTSDRINEIAAFNSNDLEELNQNIFDSKTLNIFKGGNVNKKSAYASDETVTKPILESLYKANFFNNLQTLANMPKNQSGDDLMAKTVVTAAKLTEGKINYNLSSSLDPTDFQSTFDGIIRLQNIKKNGGTVIDFDIESLGGINSKGHQQLDYITEISAVAKQYMPGQESVILEDMSTMFGFSQNEYNKIKAQLDTIKTKPLSKYTGEDQVLLKRLSRAADPNIIYDYSDGFEIKIKDTINAIDDKDLNVSVKEAMRGLEKMREFGIHQENYLKTQGPITANTLTDYKKNYVKNVQEFVFNGNGKKGTYKDALLTGHNILNFDGPQMQAFSGHQVVTNKANNIAILDTFSAVKYIEEYVGQGAMHNNISASDITAATKLYGSSTQDFFREFFGPKGAQAHNARVDVDNHMYMVMESKFGNLLESNMIKANHKMSGLKGGYIQEKRTGIFYGSKTATTGFGNRNNALSFVYNPLDDSFMSYGGYKVNKATGEVSKESFDGWGPKANAMYEKKVYDVDFNDNWKDIFRSMGMSDKDSEILYQQYANLNSVKIVESREYVDQKALEKRIGKEAADVATYGGGKVYYDIVTNEQQLATTLGLKVGYKNTDGSFDPKKESIEALGLQTMIKDQDGNIKVKALSVDEAIDSMMDRSAYRTSVDATARTIREASYSKLQAQRKFGISNAIDGRRLKMSQLIAEQISKNKDLTMDITTPLIQELGWMFNGKNKILPETLTKASVLDEYLGAGENVFAAMEEIFAEKGLADTYEEFTSANGKQVFKKAKGMSEEYAKKDFIFNRTLQKTLESISNNPNLISGSSPAIMTKFEADKIDFNMFDIFPELSERRMRGSVANTSSDILSINLNGNDGILKTFSNGLFGEQDIVKNSNAAYDALINAYEIIGSDERFKGVWGNLSLDEVKKHRGGNLSIINDKMMSKLRSFTNNQRETNSGFGYMFERTVQDPLKAFNLLSEMSKNEIKELLSNNYANVDNFVYAGSASNSSDIINSIVDNYFMTFTEADLNKQIAGLSSGQQKAMRSNYKLAKQDAYKRAQELLSATGKNTGIDLIMTGTGQDANLLFQRGSDVRKLDMYQYTLNNGIIETKIGSNYHAVGSAYNVSNMVKNGRVVGRSDKSKLDIKVTNAVENAMDHLRSLDTVVNSAIEGERDILDALTYNINSARNQVLREALPRREANNYSNTIQRAMQVDASGLVSILPELEDAGILDTIAANAGIDSKYVQMFKDTIEKTRRADKNGLKRIRNHREMVSLDKALYLQLFYSSMPEMINGEISFNDKITKEAFNSISGYTKVNQFVDGMLTLDTTPNPHGAARFDKDSRPPVYQYGNTELYNKKDLDKGIALGKKRSKSVFDHVFSNSNISSTAGEKFLYNVNGKKTSGLTLKYLQMDSNTLRNTLLTNKNLSSATDKFNEIFKDSNAGKILTDKIKDLNTYEQQTLMNSRVFDVGFNKTNIQSIAAKKKLIVEHADTVALIKEMNNKEALFPKLINGKIVYTRGINVSTNQVLGRFGDDEEVIRAKFDGLFRTRYYKDGEMVSEKELNKFIKGLGPNVTSSTDIINAINSNFDQRSEVIRKFQTYGQKAFNDTMEKSTVETLAMGMGTLDKELYNFLSKKDKSLLGNVLSHEYEKEVLKAYGKVDINGKSFIDRYFTEKHAFSDFLSSMEGFEDVSQIVALDTFKHQSSSMAITNGLRRMKEANALTPENLDILLGEGKWSMKDGRVLFDDVRSLNLTALKEQNKDAYNAFNSYDVIKDKDGNIVGHKGYSHVVQVRDDSAGTFAGRFTKEAMEDGSVNSYKGVKFSKNMNTTLNALKYNSDSMELTKNRFLELGMEEEFNKTFGHMLDESGNLKSNYLGKSVLAPVTDRTQELLLKTPGQKLLSEYADDPRYSHLLEEFGRNANKVSIDVAENSYSYAQGKRAIGINTQYTSREYDRLTKELPEHLRFNEIDLTKARPGVADDWMSLDIGGQGNTVTGAVNNPYTNNLAIKYGDGARDVLFVPRMPESHYDESLIKAEHIKKLNSLQELMQQRNNSSGARKIKLEEYIANTVQEIKSLQKKDITSKTGLAGEMQSVRMDQAFFGKASGLTLNDNLSSLRDASRVKQDLTELTAKNSNSYSEAIFNGKSLLQHYSEGKAIDSVFLSEDAFKKMGYFDEDFMQKVFNNMDSEFASQNGFSKNLDIDSMTTNMKKLLTTHGDSFIAVRYPEIMEGSDTMVRGYLKSDLRHNQIQASAHTGAKMRLDHDGDSLGLARAQNKNGESTLNYITNRKGADKSLVEFAESVDNSMMIKAVNDNWYWDDEVRNRIKSESNIARMSKVEEGQTMIEAVGKGKMIDGQLVSSMLDPEISQSKYQEYFNKYRSDLELTAGNKGDHSYAVKAIKDRGDSIEDYKKAFAYQMYEDEKVAKSANQAIGEINATNAKIKMAFSGLLDPEKSNYKYLQTTGYDLFHIAEEAAISAKSSIAGLDPDRASQWNTMALQLLGGDGDASELTQGMKDWAENYTIKDMRFNQYWDESSVFQEKMRETFKNKDLDFAGFNELMKDSDNRVIAGKEIINDFINNLAEMGTKDNVGKFIQGLSLGQSTNGISRNLGEHLTIDGTTSNADKMFEAIEMMRSAEQDFKNTHISEKLQQQTFSSGNSIDEIISASERNTSKKSLSHAILEGATDVFKGIGSSGIAMGALGIAAGVMALGFVGGRPRPADVHAMEEAQDFQAPMDGYSSLADPGLQFRQGGSNGYVVNINARTDKGRDHAISALQEAISSGTSSNINVSMNINDKYGNINDRELERAMADVLR